MHGVDSMGLYPLPSRKARYDPPRGALLWSGCLGRALIAELRFRIERCLLTQLRHLAQHGARQARETVLQ